MERKLSITLFALLATVFMLMAIIPVVSGLPSSPTVLDRLGSERRDLGALSDKSVQAQGGNVTQLNIEVLAITQSWQGYYGNVSGRIILDNANNDTFYDWNLTSAEGEVYSSREISIDFGDINCTNGSERIVEMGYLGHLSGDGDSVINTFNQTSHPSFLIGATTNITENSCYSTNAFINTGQSASDYYQILLSDTDEKLVYTTIIDNDQIGFDGGTHDFQLMVGENEHSGSEGPTLYYFWVELGS